MKPLNYAIQCTDIVSGQTGDFAFDTDEYLSADKPLQFKAKTPVFHGLQELFDYCKKNDIAIFCEMVNWKPQ